MPDQFMTLEEFLALDDDDGREFSQYHTGPFWLKWYEVAKASYLKYGSGGPPVGTMVITLRPGFGGMGLDVRTFTGVYESDDRYFSLQYTYGHSRHTQTCLSHRKTWWRDFCVQEDYPNGKPLPIV